MTKQPTVRAVPTGRSIPEWFGATPDSAIPERVKRRIWLREGGRCHITGRKILVGDAYDFDHKIPLGRGGEHRETNLFPALRDKHREKTAQENSEDAKADRTFAKHHGLHPKPKGNNRLRSQGFQKSRAWP